MRLTATFTGADGSLGYRTGQEYELDVDIDFRGRPTILRPKYCPYTSLWAFLDNWEKVSLR